MLHALALAAALAGPPRPAVLHEAPFPFDTSEGTKIVFVPGAPLTKPHSHEFDDPFWGSAKVTAAVIGSGALGDWGSTEFALHHCPTCHEANPFGQGKTQRIGLQVFFIAVTSASHWGLKRLGAHTKAKILLWVLGAAKGFAFANNMIHGIRGR